MQTADLAPLPPIPAKRYFTIGEVSELCQVKAHVLRYWEQEFTQLRPVKRRGNRRYYQHHEVLLIRRIRELLYGQGFTIQGARQQLTAAPRNGTAPESEDAPAAAAAPAPVQSKAPALPAAVRAELLAIRDLLLGEA
ncbi:MAG: MerR family transcriptional regulator [Rhodocyclaceae bacterium]|nr:MerR family transcriptional regulator [Rhodocyclaceae bacterium]